MTYMTSIRRSGKPLRGHLKESPIGDLMFALYLGDYWHRSLGEFPHGLAYETFRELLWLVDCMWSCMCSKRDTSGISGFLVVEEIERH